MFLCMLVQAEVLRKVKLTFLMVGHTHEDVDQMFSCINRAANQRNLLTLEHLHSVCREGFTPTPKTVHLDSLWDFRKLATFRGVLQGIQEPHVFKIHKMDGDVTISYKNWPLQTEPYRHLRVRDIVPNLEEPSIVEPNLGKMEATITDMRRDLKRWAEAGKFSESECQWWNDYLIRLGSTPSVQPLAPTSLSTFVEAGLEGNSLEANMAEALNRHMDRLQHSASLRIGRR
ncbi:hypothetical protein FSP39_002742 [Pinctada imbricata]|uniref:DUF7869 domain-containing protein n=1 Tax=Pinctada imbricata TaxID=66713 RepID=A0AA88Y7E7_PINIB|nr:hypothetical protein FSP39_002742 [Pinctada imbricata]